jgi:diguanylate cyclase (GGDEF)-like protein
MGNFASDGDVDSISGAHAPEESMFGLGAIASRGQQRGALAICAALALAAICAGIFGRAPGPEIRPFVPIIATFWSLADLLTACLFLAQFCVNGNASVGVLGVAYAFSGFMSAAFLAGFPDVFRSGVVTLGDEQVASYVWFIWHCAFPALVIVSASCTSPLDRIVSSRRIRLLAIAIVAIPLLSAALMFSQIFFFRQALPHLIVAGHFQPFYRIAMLPFAVLLNALACLILLRRRKRLTPLALWLAVAAFSATLDCVMVDLSSARYSYAWDTGKLITAFTSSIVLVMMLTGILELYSRLARVARTDVLTSLQNRRAYQEHLQLVFRNARRLRGSIGLLMVDVDNFKAFNDSHGHLAGDECLRAVAGALVGCIKRPLDLVARYGGEEFVVVLPDTQLAGVLLLAERLRVSVEELAVVLGEKPLGGVTVSIGVGYVEDARSSDEAVLFGLADRALYEAKDRGRNRAILGTPYRSAPAGSEVTERTPTTIVIQAIDALFR